MRAPGRVLAIPGGEARSARSKKSRPATAARDGRGSSGKRQEEPLQLRAVGGRLIGVRLLVEHALAEPAPSGTRLPVSARGRSDQPELAGRVHRLGPASRAELLHEVADVELYRRGRDVQALPEQALEQLITRARDIDMDEVRASIAASSSSAEGQQGTR